VKIRRINWNILGEYEKREGKAWKREGRARREKLEEQTWNNEEKMKKER